MKKPKLIVLLGPTAVGKTRLSLDIAERYNAEIISGDSMQVYRGMDIGTAKITELEKRKIPHHLIDIKDPNEPFSVSEFQRLAREKINDIHARGKQPIIVGGTGLYIESLCYDFEFNPTHHDNHYRDQLLNVANELGNQALHDQLMKIDPVAAKRIHPNDQRRVIRALEVFHVTGDLFSQQLRGDIKESPFDLCMIGLTMDRDLLYKRIEERIDLMADEGLLEEVKSLLAKGYTHDSIAMQGLGYKEIIQFIHGEYNWERAIYLLKRNTRRFAKRQLSWFRHMKDIHWVDVTNLKKIDDHLLTISVIITKEFTKSFNKI